jgi:hypothetical protein
MAQAAYTCITLKSEINQRSSYTEGNEENNGKIVVKFQFSSKISYIVSTIPNLLQYSKLISN